MKTFGVPGAFPVSRNSAITFSLLVLGILAAFEVAQVIITNDLASLAYAAILTFGLAVTIVILNDWKRGLYILVAWIIFEDFVRKYLGNNMAIYFAKDALAIILYFSFLWTIKSKGIKKFKVPFRVALFLFFLLCLVQVFNPASTSIWYGILGMKVNFLYVPLIYVGYAFIESEEDLRRLFSFLSVLILIVAGLGLAQSIIGPSFLNPEHLQDDIRGLSTLYRATSSGLLAYRPTSVFVSAGRFQDFLVLSWIISMGYAAYLMLRHSRGRILAFTALGVVAAASVMSASRGVFMWNAGAALVVTAGFLWGAHWSQQGTIRVVRIIYRVAFFSGAGILILIALFPEALNSRLAIYSETLLPQSPMSELAHRTQTYPFQQLVHVFDNPRWPYGIGTGTCSLGQQYIIRIMGAQPMSGGSENGFGSLIAELGILGLLLWISLGFSIAISAWKIVTKLRRTPWFPLVFAIFVYAIVVVFLMMYSGNSAYQDFVLNAYLWLLLGILFRLRLFPKAFEIARPEGDLRTG